MCVCERNRGTERQCECVGEKCRQMENYRSSVQTMKHEVEIKGECLKITLPFSTIYSSIYQNLYWTYRKWQMKTTIQQVSFWPPLALNTHVYSLWTALNSSYSCSHTLIKLSVFQPSEDKLLSVHISHSTMSLWSPRISSWVVMKYAHANLIQFSEVYFNAAFK